MANEIEEYRIPPIVKVKDKIGVLTAKGAKFEIPEEGRASCIIFEDGSFYYGVGHVGSAEIQSLRIRAEKVLGIQLQLAEIDSRQIEDAYRELEGVKVSSVSDEEVSGEVSSELFQILSNAAAARASDVHLAIKEDGAIVEFRMLGDITHHNTYAKEFGEALARSIYYYCYQKETSYKPSQYQAGQIQGKHVGLPDIVEAVRVQWNPLEQDGRSVVMRLLYSLSDARYQLSRLGFNASQLKLLSKLRKNPSGIILISGPTGSGKSTTLTVNLLNQYAELGGRKKTMTVEDPPEFVLPGGIPQFSITETSDSTKRQDEFDKAFRAALRSDPDIVMVGEIRDKVSGALAVRAARSGHLIWSSVHAKSALEIITQLEEYGVQSKALTDPGVIIGLIGQRLVKELCPNCKIDIPENMDEETLERLHKLFPNDKGLKFQGRGCDLCSTRGYIGRTVIAEVIGPDAEILRLAKDNLIAEARIAARRKGHLFLIDHGLEKVAQGLIDFRDLEDVIGVITPDVLEKGEGGEIAA